MEETGKSKPKIERKRLAIGALCIVVGVSITVWSLLSAGKETARGIRESVFIDKELVRAKEDKDSVLTAVQERTEWQKPETLLASTPQRRLRAAKQLAITDGEQILVLVSVLCKDCEREAMELIGRTNKYRITAVAAAPPDAVIAWGKRLSLNYRVISVSQETFDDLGSVILPTIVKLQNGQAVVVSEHAEVVE